MQNDGDAVFHIWVGALEHALCVFEGDRRKHLQGVVMWENALVVW